MALFTLCSIEPHYPQQSFSRNLHNRNGAIPAPLPLACSRRQPAGQQVGGAESFKASGSSIIRRFSCTRFVYSVVLLFLVYILSVSSSATIYSQVNCNASPLAHWIKNAGLSSPHSFCCSQVSNPPSFVAEQTLQARGSDTSFSTWSVYWLVWVYGGWIS